MRGTSTPEGLGHMFLFSESPSTWLFHDISATRIFRKQALAHRRPPGFRKVTLVEECTLCREIRTKHLGICTMCLQERVNVNSGPIRPSF